MNNLPFVSIIIPCRNEEKFIEMCLKSILANDYPKERMEIFIIDGESTDNTRLIIQKISEQYPFIQLMDNNKRITPSALNIGIKKAKGELIIRMDAHSLYKKNYISSCVAYSKKYNADNVGGIFATTTHAHTLVAQTIASALSHPFGVGNSAFRTYPKHVQEADTVAYGCYKREVFDRIGIFNENLARSQDMEFNIRLKKAGGKIILFPEIICYYLAPSTYIHFIKHTISDGIWAIYPMKFTKKFLAPRHYVPLMFILSLIINMALSVRFTFFRFLFLVIAASYILLNLIASAQVAYKKHNFRYLVLMPCIFFTFHLCYGIGSCIGLLKIIYESISKKQAGRGARAL